MKTLIIFLMFLFVLFITSIGHAGTVYLNNGKALDEVSDVRMYHVQFKNKVDAEEVASHLQNGEVFQDQDTKLYQVFYGNVKIAGLVVLTSINQN